MTWLGPQDFELLCIFQSSFEKANIFKLSFNWFDGFSPTPFLYAISVCATERPRNALYLAPLEGHCPQKEKSF